MYSNIIIFGDRFPLSIFSMGNIGGSFFIGMGAPKAFYMELIIKDSICYAE